MRMLPVTAASSSDATHCAKREAVRARSAMLMIVLTSLTGLTGCASAFSDAASGYPASPATPSVAAESSAIHSRVASADAEPARDHATVAAAPLEPKFVPHELETPAPREPVTRRDFVECWQCRR